MRIKVGIAIYKSKARIKDYCRLSYNFNFIKGSLHNQQEKIQCMNGPTIPDGLLNSRCGSFRCVRVILDAAKICLDKYTRISSFFHFGPRKTYSTVIQDHKATPIA